MFFRENTLFTPCARRRYRGEKRAAEHFSGRPNAVLIIADILNLYSARRIQSRMWPPFGMAPLTSLQPKEIT